MPATPSLSLLSSFVVVEPVLCDMDNKEVERLTDGDDAPLVSSKERSSTPPEEGSPKDRSSSPEAPEVRKCGRCVCLANVRQTQCYVAVK